MKTKRNLETLVEGGIASGAILNTGSIMYLAANFEDVLEKTNGSDEMAMILKFGLCGMALLYSYYQIKEIVNIEKNKGVDYDSSDRSLTKTRMFIGLGGMAIGSSHNNPEFMIFSGLMLGGSVADYVTDKLKSIYHNIYTKKEKTC